jgi:dTMP kinase
MLDQRRLAGQVVCLARLRRADGLKDGRDLTHTHGDSAFKTSGDAAGVLVAFEGVDQSGKETQARRQRRRLEAAGRRVVEFDFPCYTTPIAQEIGRALSGERAYTPDVVQLLFIANRFEYKARIAQALAEGCVVLCDRYRASSVAYGDAFGLDPQWLTAAQVPLPPPALTVLLDIAPATAARRKAANRDRFESDLALLERVRASYLRQAAAGGWVIIDGEISPDEVERAVTRAFSERLGI